jgi:hypothetical protein
VSGRGAVLLGRAAGQDLAGQAVAAHGGAVAAAPVGGAGHAAAVDVDDVAVAEGNQVVHGLAGSVVVGGPHDLHAGRGRRQPPGDADDRQLRGELLQPRGWGLRAEQDQRLAPVGEQRVGGALLVAAGGHRAERELVPGRLGHRVQAFHQVGVERALQAEPHAELADFTDCVRTGRTPAVTGQDARAALSIARAAIESVTTGSPVRMDQGPVTPRSHPGGSRRTRPR